MTPGFSVSSPVLFEETRNNDPRSMFGEPFTTWRSPFSNCYSSSYPWLINHHSRGFFYGFFQSQMLHVWNIYQKSSSFVGKYTPYHGSHMGIIPWLFTVQRCDRHRPLNAPLGLWHDPLRT